MNTQPTTARLADEITDGSWIVRFTGDRESTGMIAARSWVDTGLTLGSHTVYEAAVTIDREHNGTTLASAGKIITVMGFTNVIPLVAWRIENGEKTEKFEWYPTAA
jgi:hypothetical protein